MTSQAYVLLSAVVGVGVLHTMVPDHWAPIVLIARKRGWSRWETSRAALIAGAGHTVTTLALGGIVWLAGVEIGARFGHVVDTIASAALVALGLWIAIGALVERGHSGREHSQGHHHGHGHTHSHHDHHPDHDHADAGTDALYVPLGQGRRVAHHAHVHRHGRGRPHAHWHDHGFGSAHAVTADMELNAPLHDHRHRLGVQAGLLIALGSSPMVEGLPAFFAASRYEIGFLVLMAFAFAASTILTYVLLCTVSLAGLQRVDLGPFERYAEAISGGFIAIVGLAFWIWPIA